MLLKNSTAVMDDEEILILKFASKIKIRENMDNMSENKESIL